MKQLRVFGLQTSNNIVFLALQVMHKKKYQKFTTLYSFLIWSIIFEKKNKTTGDVTQDNLQRRFLAQHRVQMLEQCCNLSKWCRNNVVSDAVLH